MADRFYGYQYDTNPRKLNSQYASYQNRYSQDEEPVETTNNIRRNKIRKDVASRRNNYSATNNRNMNHSYETQEEVIPEHGIKQVVNKKNRKQSGVHKRNKSVRSGDVLSENSQNEKASKVNMKARLRIVLFLLAGFSVLFAISYQNSLISESFNKKEQYKKEMESLSKTNQQIEVSIENNLNLNTIEQSAREKIGMQKLNNNQKIYVSLPKQDYVAPASEQIVMEEDTSFFHKLFSLFK